MPTIDIPDKICPHCGGTSWRTEKYNTLKKGVVIRYRCSEEHRERERRYYQSHKEEVKIYNSERIRDGYNKTPKMREYYKLFSKKQRDELSDNHIKKIIAYGMRRTDKISIRQNELPEELILMKRKQLLLKRQIKAQCVK